MTVEVNNETKVYNQSFIMYVINIFKKQTINYININMHSNAFALVKIKFKRNMTS